MPGEILYPPPPHFPKPKQFVSAPLTPIPGAAVAGSGSTSTCGEGGCVGGASSSNPFGGSGTSTSADWQGCCVDPGAELESPDGRKILAADLQVGDEIMGRSEAGCRRKQTISKIELGEEARVEIRAGARTLVCSVSHPIAVSHGGFMSAGSLWEGAQLLGDDESIVKLDSVKNLPSGQVIKLVCEPDHIFFAGGFVQHNHVLPKPFPLSWT